MTPFDPRLMTSTSRRFFSGASALSLTLALSCVATSAAAQTLAGQVTDSSGQARFQGANVTILELGRSVTSDRFGEYRFANIPAGMYTVEVNYLGADKEVTTVNVPETGQTLNFTLGDSISYEDNIIVVGTRAAQAGALNQQRNADSIISVIDSDGLGNFPDTTVADSLQRVVGLSIETDQGEGRYVTVRGINTDLISTSINGVRTPSPEDRRGVLLDGVPSDLLDGITVQKSLTPDVDADSLGGVIDLKTISAFERPGQFLRVKTEGRYNEIDKGISPKLTGTYSNTFSDKFGLAVSLNYQNVGIETHNNEAGGWGTEGTDTFFLNDDYEQRWYDITRERYGFVGNFDFRPSDSTDLYVRTLLNVYSDDEVRNKFEYKDLDDGAPISATQSSIAINEVDAEVQKRKEVRQIRTLAIGGETKTENWNLSYEGAYAFAEEDDSNNHDAKFRFEDIQDLGVGNLTIDTSRPETPVLSGAPALAAVFDPSNYLLDSFEQQQIINQDTEYSLRFDAERFTSLGNRPLAIKTGFKFRDREKTRDADITIYGPEDDISLTGFTSDQFIDNWRLPNAMPAFPDPDLTTALRGNAQGNLELEEDDTNFESLSADYAVDEQVFAAYLMGTLEVGPATIIAGARLEQTNLDLTGNNFVEESNPDDVTVITVEDDYTHILPSVNLTYDFSDRLIGRAAYYASLVRPSFGDVAPFARLNDDRDEAQIGNPDLDPLEANNFDVALEYYPNDISVISVGAFYKDISNAIFNAQFDIEDVPANIDLSRVLNAEQLLSVEEIETAINVGNSEVYGVEFNYVQDVAVLSEALDGVVFSANLTLTDSSSDIPDGDATREVRFLKQSDTIANVALAYDKGPFDLRVSANYRGDYIDELVLDGGPGDAEFGNLDRFAGDRLLIEASAKYKINDQFQIYLEGKNLTDEPEYYYFGDESRLSQYDEFGRTFIFGARYTY